MNTSDIVFGAVDAIAGGLVGGLLALQAVRMQSRRDERRDAHNRSVSAALRLAESVVGLDWAVGAWGQSDEREGSRELDIAYRQFALTEVAATGELSDEELRQRLHIHSRLVGACLVVISQVPRAKVVKLLREHASSVSRALEAHQQGHKLPAYDSPPLNPPVDTDALFAWQPRTM
jgi:hypothetical protein